jgi:hypothetical protein
MIHKDSTPCDRDTIEHHDVPECTPSCVDIEFRNILVEVNPLYRIEFCGGQRTLNKLQVRGLSCLREEA